MSDTTDDVLSPEAAAVAAVQAKEGATPTRRPRRKAAAKDAQEVPAASSADNTTASDVAARKETAPATPPKRRGRPKKADLAEEPGFELVSEAAAEAPADDASADKGPETTEDAHKTTQPADKDAAHDADKKPADKPGKPRKTHTPSSQDKQDKAGKANGHDNARNSGKQQDHGRNNSRRRNRRSNEPIAPQITREELAELKMAELRQKAHEIELDVSELRKKDELIDAVFAAMVKAEGFIEVEGLLDILPEGYGFLRTSGYLPGEKDAYVGMSTIRKNNLRRGDMLVGQIRPPRENEKYPALHRIDTVNGVPLAEMGTRAKFSDLTPVYPDERLIMEHGKNTITARTIDLVAPIGKGQRGLIVSPPKAGKTTILKDIAAAISANDPDVHLMCLLVDERPEEVTDMERSIRGEVISSTFDMPCENHIAVAELVIERAKRLVEGGADVVILLDSITRLARAYNLAQPASGRILSGGVDSTALYPPKRFLGAARNIENGGSLTILASALIDTGSKMDEVIFEEFKGTGNMELKLDRSLADRRIFPAIDPVSSGTRKEELLIDPQEAPFIWGVRRILANLNNTERSMEMLIKSLKQTETNQEFLIRTAKKAQEKNASSIEI